MSRLTRFGGYADTVVVPAAQAFHFPDELSDAEAAAVPVNYLTASLALYRMAALRAGETVLVHNAGGGVGIAATQLARLRRATVIGTASAFKHDALRSFGVDHAIDYRARRRRGRGEAASREAAASTSSSIRSAARSFTDSYRMLAPLGRLVIFGLSAAAPGERRNCTSRLPRLVVDPAFQSDVADQPQPRRLRPSHRPFVGRASPARAADGHAVSELHAGRLAPVVARTFPLERAADAHRFIQSRSNIGKVVLTT